MGCCMVFYRQIFVDISVATFAILSVPFLSGPTNFDDTPNYDHVIC